MFGGPSSPYDANAEGVVLLDDTLLAQRAAFLRDDSLLAIVMLSDENDCSVIPGNQTWVVLNIEDQRPMFKASSACETDPNAECCYSCPLAPPEGCAVDPACSSNPANVNRLPPELDGKNLRCYDQKRRFGVDFLYPTERYVNALTRTELCQSAPDLSTDGCEAADIVVNPLFKGGRLPSEVYLGGILGVPWQALAANRDANGRSIDTEDELRFKASVELSTDGTWERIIGSPGVPWQAATDAKPEVAGSPRIPPRMPEMLETTQFPRSSSGPNAITGRDYDTAQGTAPEGGTPRPDDLQYACIFPLPTPRNCAALDPNIDQCDCYVGAQDRPLCEQTPGVTAAGPLQYWAKAYPSTRQLQVLKDFGEQTRNSVVASICARNTTDASRSDYGYRPAMAALLERLQAGSDNP